MELQKPSHAVNYLAWGKIKSVIWGKGVNFVMPTEKSPYEILEAIRAIIAKDLAGETLPRTKPVTDPALWRAIQNQEKIQRSPSLPFSAVGD